MEPLLNLLRMTCPTKLRASASWKNVPIERTWGATIIGTKNRNKEMGRCIIMYIHGEIEEESMNTRLSLRESSHG